MEYVWLKYEDYEGHGPALLNVVKTTDGKKFNGTHYMKIGKGEVFLCEKNKIEDYTYTRYEDGEDGEVNISFGGSEKTKPTNMEKRDYYKKCKRLDLNRKFLLHYLSEEKIAYLYGDAGRLFNIKLNDITLWIKKFHHEYLLDEIRWSEFEEVLVDLDRKKYIRYENQYSKSNNYSIVALEKLFQLSEIKEGERKDKPKTIKDTKSYTIEFGDIVFDLERKYFKIGVTEIENISFSDLPYNSLRDKTPKTIKLLYAIIRNAKKGDPIIKGNYNEYSIYFDEIDNKCPYKRNAKEDKEFEIYGYISNLKALLKLSKFVSIESGEDKNGDKFHKIIHETI